MVKMYMLGEHLRMIDGGLSIADNIISMVGNDLGYDFYDTTVTSIKETTAKDIQALAQILQQRQLLYRRSRKGGMTFFPIFIY